MLFVVPQRRIKRRSQIEAELAQLQRSVDRMWDDYISERIPVEVAEPKLKEMKSRQEALEAELADQPPEEKTVGLHPGPRSQPTAADSEEKGLTQVRKGRFLS